MKMFQDLMLVERALDKVMYKLFPTTLSELVRIWYKKLSPSSVQDFATFSSKFVCYFQGA